MGNVAAGRRRQSPVVEDRLTQPQRLVMQLPDMDTDRLRRLIRSGDLAPCFDAAEDAVDEQAEECPICFYFYPSLNRSKCCGKGICTEAFGTGPLNVVIFPRPTECFLQLMPSKTSEVVQGLSIELVQEEKNFKETKIREHLESQIAGHDLD
ncbi:hypothetical protein EJB05_41774 [Eragrostis curvula]|uniref:Uncharacterized protein n=1 Tax=Eragrostis curvula TaxID=38414 RepID=A0A5J9TCM6_9POAL|nr:hypothetical protein EJB05_41774 [Eragrostis curvula]